jgi:hypothetical protein
VLARARIQNDSAAKCHYRRIPSYDESITFRRNPGFFKPKLSQLGSSGCQLIRLEQYHSGKHFPRAKVKVDSCPILDGNWRVGECNEPDIDHIGRVKIPGFTEQITAVHVVDFHTRDVNGCPGTHVSFIHVITVCLYPANPDLISGRE